MQTTTFAIRACCNGPVSDDWSAQLAAMLGKKPRRLSRWCELGLFGALSCVRQRGNTGLPDDLAIRVYTEFGTVEATQMAIAQSSEHLPMPFTFMQTQPGQLFNALGAALDWHGDGYNTSCSNRVDRDIALLRDIRQSALIAWVDVKPDLISHWIWLERTSVPVEANWKSVDSIFQTDASARWLKIDAGNAIFQAE